MNNRSKSIKNLAVFLLEQGVAIAVGLLLPRLYMTEYGSEVNGLFSSLQQLLVYMGLFEAGIGAATQQALYDPMARDDWGRVSRVLSATHRYYQRAGACYLAALSGVALLYPLLARTDLPYWTVAAVVFLYGIGNVVNFWLQGKYTLLLHADGKSYVLSALSTIINLITNLVRIALILMGFDLVAVVVVSLLGSLIQGVYITCYARRHYRRLSLKEPPDETALSQRGFVMVHQVAGLVFQNTDALILTMVCGLKVVSVYAVYKLVVGQLEIVLRTLMNSINFVLGQTFQIDRERFIRRIDLVESVNGAAFFSLFSVALFLLPPFIRLYTAGVTDVEYLSPWLPELFVACSLLSAIRLPMNSTINYAGHFKETAPRAVAEMVINLSISLVGVFLWGIYGVLLGTVAALLYRTNDILCYTNRRILNRSPRRTYWVYAVDLAVFLLMRWVYPLLFGSVDSWAAFLRTGVLATALSVSVFAAAQALLVPHCRRVLTGVLLHRRHVSEFI